MRGGAAAERAQLELGEGGRNFANFTHVAHGEFLSVSPAKVAVFCGFARGFDDVKERADGDDVCGCRKAPNAHPVLVLALAPSL